LVGRTLSHYRITAAIGAGGMGEVYRATDTKLGRKVAPKVLPPDEARDPERLARFQRDFPSRMLLVSAVASRAGSVSPGCTPMRKKCPT
jgi:serine/threonine protein kinase